MSAAAHGHEGGHGEGNGTSAGNGNGNDRPPTPPEVHIRALLIALAIGAALYTCVAAAGLILPVLIAAVTAIIFNPIVKLLTAVHVPRFLAAAIVLGGFATGVAALIHVAWEPAVEAVQAAPRAMLELEPRLAELTRPLREANKVGDALDAMDAEAPSTRPQKVRVVESDSSVRGLLAGLPRQAMAALTVAILTYFSLVFGELFLRRLVTLVPTLSEKKTTVDIVRSIQSEMSRYMLTISLINVGLGVATWGMLLLVGFEADDAVFWGTVAGLLNFAPYLGPALVMVMLALVGMVQFPQLTQALLPVGGFVVLNLLESQLVTPLALGRSLALNPLIILLWLFVWGWIWGIVGLLLAMPMLVCFKIVAARVDSLRAWSVMLER
ncbi:MAG TPA: AI-2E family transporter [Xanthomonadaceae bacterium]|nr:AI-2E family transporter [Xanthomonadaceae bacterium]